MCVYVVRSTGSFCDYPSPTFFDALAPPNCEEEDADRGRIFKAGKGDEILMGNKRKQQVRGVMRLKGLSWRLINDSKVALVSVP